jgi:pimeloyl-ACP methyl ester carboxylesterase
MSRSRKHGWVSRPSVETGAVVRREDVGGHGGARSARPTRPRLRSTVDPKRLALLVAVLAALAGGRAAGAAASTGPPPHPAPPAAAGHTAADLGLGAMVGFRALYRDLTAHYDGFVRELWVPYTAWNGQHREAALLLPSWYGPKLDPPIPLVISPHGRGGTAAGNARLWGDLPAFGPFAVVNPQGQGRRLIKYSWGWSGQIADLARMPQILEHALPWLHVAPHRIYAVGSSMGGQETLLLDALHPRLLAGAVALDSATNMAARFRAFPGLHGGRELQQFARAEIGGTPSSAPAAYAARSPLSYARVLATDRVPLYIWWSTRDRVVVDQNMESGLLYREIKRINPAAPVYQYIGSWAHSTEMNPLSQLPSAVVELGLISLDQALLGVAVSEGFAAPQMQDGIATLLLPVQIPEQIPVPGGVAHSALTAALRVPTGVVQVLSELQVPHPHSAGPAGRAPTSGGAPAAAGQTAPGQASAPAAA